MQDSFSGNTNEADRVLITGANGFIGSHITRAFIAHGVTVGCLVRKSSDLANLEGLDVELRYADIRDPAGLADAVKGYDVLIHDAALVGDWGAYRDFYQTNVRGTLNVLEACRQNGIKQVLMAGTCSVYGEEDSRTVKDEESPLNPHYRYFLGTRVPCKLNWYRDTKTVATILAAEHARRFEMDLTILDPVWVYGEREVHTGFYEYLSAVRDGMIVMPGRHGNKFHVIYAGDLAEAYYLAFAKRIPGVQRFIVGNARAERMSRIYRLFCREAGLKPPVNLPKLVFYPAGFLMEMLASALGAAAPPLLTRGRVNLFYDSIQYSAEKARRVLGFVNEHSLEEGIAKTVSWYRERGMI
jgi:nucleoside-diphosphate-sugar epimerase